MQNFRSYVVIYGFNYRDRQFSLLQRYYYDVIKSACLAFVISKQAIDDDDDDDEVNSDLFYTHVLLFTCKIVIYYFCIIVFYCYCK